MPTRSFAAVVLLVAASTACRKPPEAPTPVPPIAMAEPPRLSDRNPVSTPQIAAAPAQPRAQAVDPDLVLAQSARARLQQAFGTQGAPLLEVTVAAGVVVVTARPGSSATRAQVLDALTGLPGLGRVDADALPPGA